MLLVGENYFRVLLFLFYYYVLNKRQHKGTSFQQQENKSEFIRTDCHYPHVGHLTNQCHSYINSLEILFQTQYIILKKHTF